MNMGSKGKKRMVLPTRPDPPSVEKMIEDLNRADSNDPVFRLLQNSTEDFKARSQSSEVDERYMQSRRYLELNEKLQEGRTDLILRRETVTAVRESLEHSVAEVKATS